MTGASLRSVVAPMALAVAPCLLAVQALPGQQPVAAAEALINRQIGDLDKLRGRTEQPENARARRALTKQLAREIRSLPSACTDAAGAQKIVFAGEVANLATEGDSGHDALQEMTTTYAEALRECPDQSPVAYLDVARLARYEHMRVSLDNPRMATAVSTLVTEERDIQKADFALADLHGKLWTLKDLRGKVVLVNFWATWCPPCIEEMPTLDALYRRFQKHGLMVLAISSDDASKVDRFLVRRGVSYPVLLDPAGLVSERFHVQGIPRSLVYDRAGTLVAQAMDGRTQKQFLKLLGRAGLR